jgi:iron complex outermembrane recepter protein
MSGVNQKVNSMNRSKSVITHRSRIALAVTAALSMYQLPLYAQETTAKNTELETIQVTARKKVESLQDVPMSVSAISAKRLDDTGVDNLQELSTYIPGFEQPRLAIQSRMVLRGVSSGDNASFEQAVGTYVDGIYRGRMNQQRAGFFDVERIEVLKGPQVTLYGNSSIGGAISMITKRPEKELSGEFGYKYGIEYQEHEVNGAVNLPVSDDLAVRVAGKWREQNKGTAENLFSGQTEPTGNDMAYRISVAWQPSDNLSVLLRHEKGEFEQVGNSIDIYKHVDGQGNPWPNSTFTGINDGILNVGNSAPLDSRPSQWKTNNDETMLELEYEAGDLTFTSLTGQSNYDYNQLIDIDLTPIPLLSAAQNEYYEQFSQEFRMSHNYSDHFDYLVGAYFQKDDFNNTFFADFNTPILLSAATGIPVAMTSQMISPFSRVMSLEQSTRQWALFAHANFDLAEKWQASLGFRYVDISKQADQSGSTASVDHVAGFGEVRDFSWLLGLPAGSYAAPDYAVGYNIVSKGAGKIHQFNDLKREETHPMFQANLKYQMDSSAMVYLSWAKGAKSGGFDLLYEGNDRDSAEFQDEKASVFELGLKKDFDDLRVNVSAFYGTYDDLQVSVFNGTVGFVVGNAASSTSKGVDWEVNWLATDQLSFFFNGELLDAKYDSFANANCSTSEKLNTGKAVCDWSSATIPFVPKVKSVLGAEYYTELSDSYELRQLLTMSYKGSFYTASDREEQTKQDAYSLIDYRIELVSLDSDWRLALSVKNLTDENYNTYTSIIPLAPGGAFGNQLERGREYTVDVSYRF